MTPEHFLTSIVDPGMTLLAQLGGPRVSALSRRMLVAIAMQESGPSLVARYQHSPAVQPGPARGWWQFERMGGAAGVLTHASSRVWAQRLCEHCTVIPQPAAVWRALEGHDMLAAGFARLLLFTEPQPLPTTREEGWNQYMRNWRPGKPHAGAWPSNWNSADVAVQQIPFPAGEIA